MISALPLSIGWLNDSAPLLPLDSPQSVAADFRFRRHSTRAAPISCPAQVPPGRLRGAGRPSAGQPSAEPKLFGTFFRVTSLELNEPARLDGGPARFARHGRAAAGRLRVSAVGTERRGEATRDLPGFDHGGSVVVGLALN